MNQNTWQAIKFTLFSISAGVIELVSEELFCRLLQWPGWLGYLLALVLSVLWNFTFNRRYTFRSSANVGKAMLLVALFYLVFTPLSTGAQYVMTEKWGWSATIGTILCMLINFVTEFLYQKYVVFKDSIDTNDVAQRANSKK